MNQKIYGLSIYQIAKKTVEELKESSSRGTPPGKMMKKISLLNMCKDVMILTGDPHLQEIKELRNSYFSKNH